MKTVDHRPSRFDWRVSLGLATCMAALGILFLAGVSAALAPVPAASALPTGSLWLQAAAPTATLTIDYAVVNVRAGPGLTNTILGQVKQGDRLVGTGKDPSGDWWQVSYTGKTAWIYASLVTATPQGGAPAAKAAASPAVTTTTAAAAATKPAGYIAFPQGRYGATDIAVLDLSSGKTWVAAANGRQPMMRMDGVIIFNGQGGGREDLYAVSLDGTSLDHVTRHPEDVNPAWSPDGQNVAYQSTFADGKDRIFILWDALRTSEATHLLVDTLGGLKPLAGTFPVWVGDARIAFTGCDPWGNYSNCGIWAIDARTPGAGNATQLTRSPQDHSTDSLNGQLLFASPATENWDLYVVPATGGPARNLTNNPSQDWGGAFSPDGKYIAFLSDRDSQYGIWVMNADGSNPQLLLAVPQGFGPQADADRLTWGR